MAYSYLLLFNLSGCFKLGPCDVCAWSIAVIRCDFVVVISLLDVNPIVNWLILIMGDLLSKPEMSQTHVWFITGWFMHQLNTKYYWKQITFNDTGNSRATPISISSTRDICHTSEIKSNVTCLSDGGAICCCSSIRQVNGSIAWTTW